MHKEVIVTQEFQIHTIRGIQVMFDKDLSKLYGTETRILKQAVKRNIERFPEDFMFQLTDNEINYLVSQSVIPSKSYFGGAKPFVFTEQGVAMLSSVINTSFAIEISLRIIRAFVEMRKVTLNYAALFQRLDKLDQKQIETDQKFERVFKALELNIEPVKGIFYDGQIFDAYSFVSNIIRNAHKSIILLDNYIDDTVLTLFSKRKKQVEVTFYTKSISKQLQLDIEKYNTQYDKIEVRIIENVHDRFLIVDDKELYHIGASLKDLGKKWFAFSKMDTELFEMLEKLKK